MELTEENLKSPQFKLFPEIFMRPSCNLYACGRAVSITREWFFWCGGGS